MTESPIDIRNTSRERFELLEHRGTGGFAHTYKARVLDEELIAEFGTNEVALKIPLNRRKELVLKKELIMNGALHLHLKGLKSSNLVRYLGFDVFRGQNVMAMEYVEGSLRRVLGEIGHQKRLPIDRAVRIAEGVLSGLGVLHQAHVFHRDIKPENILLEGETPKIADLGIARMLDSNELASTTTGTIYYMSPEILGEEGAQFTSDLWSLGVTLYEMVTGKLPFGGSGTPIGTMTDLIRGAELVPASEVWPEIPQALSEIIKRTLSKRPADRFSSSEAMLQSLKRFRQISDDQIEREMAAICEQTSSAELTSDRESKLKDLVARYTRDCRAYQYLGEFYNRCQQYTEAIEIFKKGIEFDGNNAILHWDLALAYQQIGQRSGAVRSLEKAMSLGLDPSLQHHANTLLNTLKKRGGA